MKVRVRVLGPGWVTAEKVELYANGHPVREERILEGGRAGLKWSGEWTLPRFRHDVHLVAIASEPGVRGLYWPTAKPYQPTSSRMQRRVLGSTGAVWLDGDGDGRRTSALDYARRLMADAGGDWRKLVRALAEYDEAVAVQAASLLQARGVSLFDGGVQAEVRKSGAQVERGFQAYAEAWRQSQMARTQGKRGPPS